MRLLSSSVPPALAGAFRRGPCVETTPPYGGRHALSLGAPWARNPPVRLQRFALPRTAGGRASTPLPGWPRLSVNRWRRYQEKYITETFNCRTSGDSGQAMENRFPTA